MPLSEVPAGRHPPEDVNVVIEIPMNSEPVKYEIDKQTGAMFVDRLLTTPMRYPCNYGYIPQTLGGDGDPLDALVMMPMQLVPGSVINCRPIGILEMVDESGDDQKLIVVPSDKISVLYQSVQSVRDLPTLIRDQISHFFQHYKDLEPGKWVRVEGWGDATSARQAIQAAMETYNTQPSGH